MRAGDLTDDDIGREFLVPHTTGSGRRRLVFEGFTRRITHPVFGGGGEDDHRPFWLIMRCAPSVQGAMLFREAGGQEFSGILVRSAAVVTPLVVQYGVSPAGEIVELRSGTAESAA